MEPNERLYRLYRMVGGFCFGSKPWGSGTPFFFEKKRMKQQKGIEGVD